MKHWWLVLAGLLLVMAAGAASALAEDRTEAYAGGCCGAADDTGWFIDAVADTNPTQLQKAFAKLEADPEAKDLLATPEASLLRKVVETKKLPEIEVEEFRRLVNSPKMFKLLRAVFGLINVQRTLTT